MSSWNKLIGNESEIAYSQPKWYSEVTIVNLDKVDQTNGLDLSNAKATYEVGDKIMVLPVVDIPDNLDGNPGKVYTVKEVDLFTCTFEEGTIEGSGKVFLIKFNYNKELENELPYTLVPITVEMIQADRKNGYPLYHKGIRSAGWYRWCGLDMPNGRTKVLSELLVAMNLHSPKEDEGEDDEPVKPFEPIPGESGEDGIKFDNDGSIKLD